MRASARETLRTLVGLTRRWPPELTAWSDDRLMEALAVALRIHDSNAMSERGLNALGAMTITHELLVEINRRGLLIQNRGLVWHWFHDCLHAYARAGELS